MKATPWMVSAIALLLLVGGVRGDEQGQSAKAKEPSQAQAPKPTAEELEAKFKQALTQVTFSGRWCVIKEGQLGPEKEEKYTINSVAKLGGEMWLITARIQYGGKDILAPIPVRVSWAGDTPVIILDKLAVLGGGPYSARVLIYDHTYAGTWSAGDHGGLLNGVITSENSDAEKK
jgi:hypothetical protein